jgi:hypothetical protein
MIIIATLDPAFPYSHNTAFATGKFGKIESTGYYNQPFEISDKVAPVIDQAVYCPGAIINETTFERAFDTLFVSFSEKVVPFTDATPFVLYNLKKDKEYFFELERIAVNANEFRFKVIKINVIDYPTKGDSIWIDIQAKLADTLSNAQLVKENRRAELRIRPKPFEIKISVLHPIDPATEIPREIIDGINANNYNQNVVPINSGTFFIVEPMIDLDTSEFDHLDCAIQIFDAVGNLISECSGFRDKNGNIETYIAELNGRNKIIIIWSGTNMFKRAVGGACYLAIIKVTTPRKQEIWERKYVCVKK